MEELFVTKSIEIEASAASVWKVLTEEAYTKQWIGEGWGEEGIKGMIISSDWEPGSEVLWKNKSGAVLVKGRVTELNPYKLLRFTAFDAAGDDKFPLTHEDGITYELSEQDTYTTLHVRQGDFSVIENAEKYHKKMSEIWERILQKVKALAEDHKEIEQAPTCGKGLAINAALPARFSEVIESMAVNLELHMETLDLGDARARLEYDAYQRLALAYRDIASNLMATAIKMYSYHDLPMASHNHEKLSNPEITAAFMKFTQLEEDLITVLQKHVKADKTMLAELPR